MSITPESLNTKADDAERWASDKSYRGTEMEVTRLLSYALHFRTAADTIAALTAQVEEAKGTIEVLLGEARPAEEVLSSAQRYSDSLAEVARLTAENERLTHHIDDPRGTILGTPKEGWSRRRYSLARIDSLQAENARLTAEVGEANRRLADQTERVERMRDRWSTAETGGDAARERLDAARRDADRLAETLAAALIRGDGRGDSLRTEEADAARSALAHREGEHGSS